MRGEHITVLENEKLLIEIHEFGSELSRIYDKERHREILWDAKPEIWKRHAPVLFPFIGNCYEGRYLYDGVVRPMTAHGFARDSVFNRVSSGEDEVWYELTDSPETYEKYPFHFRLRTGHRLDGGRITVMWTVENTGSEELLFMVGGHPAFLAPAGRSVHDFTFRFEHRNSRDHLHYEAPDESGYAVPEKSGILQLTDGKVPLNPGFFKDVLTYIFDGSQITRAGLLLPDGEPYVTLHVENIPYLGVWTQEATHPFVCLEPWFGRCADRGFTGELKDRAGIMRLGAGDRFEAHYVIEIH